MVPDDSDASAEQAVARATEVLVSFDTQYDAALLRGQRAKLGLDDGAAAGEGDDARLVDDWLDLLESHQVDFTLGWRQLANAAAGDESALQALFPDPTRLAEWLARWKQRCASEAGAPPQARAQRMRRASPWIIPRNHRVEEALRAATDEGDLAPFDKLLAALREPYDEKQAHAAYAEPAAAAVTASYQTFCGT
jgi:uncharacterized protein YdiU (UPF0061 family)